MSILVKVMLSVAGVFALSAGRAWALSPADIAAAAGNGTLVTLYVGGSTAADTVLENLFKLDDAAYRLCMPGSLDIYYYKSSSGAITQRALTCTAAFTSGSYITTDSTRIAVLKESTGASINGIINVADATALPFINLVNGNLATACAAVSVVGTTLPAGTGSYYGRDCGHVNGSTASTVSLANFSPKAGISDVEPELFVGTGGVTDNHNIALTRKRAALVTTLSPTVSVPLFTALQRAYGYVSDTAVEDTSSLSTIPSLPSSILRAIFNGQSVLFADEMNINGAKLNTKLSGFSGGNDIYICRRGDSAGAMISFKANFLNQGCSPNALNIKFVAPDAQWGDDPSCTSSGCTWGSAYYADYVFAGSTAEDVRNCMDYNSSQGRLAIGVDTTESKPDTASHRYRYIKLDGAEPTLKAVMEGQYRAFVENSFNDKFTGASAERALWDAVYSRIGNRSVLVAANGNLRDAVAIGVAGGGEGDTGILAVPSSGNYPAYPVTAASVRVNPVNGQTRKTLGGMPNSCNRSYQAYP